MAHQNRLYALGFDYLVQQAPSYEIVEGAGGGSRRSRFDIFSLLIAWPLNGYSTQARQHSYYKDR